MMDKINGAQRDIVVLPLNGAAADTRPLRPFRPSDDFGSRAEVSGDGRLVALRRKEAGKIHLWVAALDGGEASGRPVMVRTDGSAAHQWATDGNALFVEDLQRRLMRITVDEGSPPSVSAPVEVADLRELGVRFWTPLQGGRFFVVLEDDTDVKRFNVIQNWAEILKGTVPTKQ